MGRFVILLCLAAVPASAQSVEVGTGFSIQGPAFDTQQATMPDFGIAVSTGAFPDDHVGIQGELSVYKLQTENNRVGSALIGMVVRTHESRRWHERVYARALVGEQWSDLGRAHPVFQPGIGFYECLRNRPAAVRFEYDYRFVPHDSRDLSTFRFVLAFVVKLGG